MLKKYLEKIASTTGSDKVVHLSDFIFGGIIGKGGFGEVRKAVQISTQKFCASKQIFQNRIEGNQFKRYVSEIDTMLKCENLFMVPLVGFTIEPPYTIITEYMLGESLDKYTRSNPKNGINLSPTQKAIIAIGISYGMTFLHKNGIIHRDLKTANIFLNSNMWPKIADFGIARFEGKNKNLTEAIGTPQYMAPELISSTSYDLKVDVYSYGLILYEMCELVKPFQDMSINEIFKKVVDRGERPPFSNKTPQILRSLIEKCWAQNPEERPSFIDIYKAFSEGKIIWPDCDQNEIKKFIEFIENDAKHKEKQKEKESKNTNLTDVLINFMEETSKTPQISSKTSEQQCQPIPDVLSNFSHPLFEQYLTYYSETITPPLFILFYQPLSLNFKKPIPSSSLNSLIRSCNLLMKRDPEFIKLFIKNGFFQDIPLTNAECLDEIVSSFTILMTEYSNLIDFSFCNKIVELTKLKSEKMLIIISFYLKSDKVINYDPIIQVLLSLEDNMLNTKCGYLYLSLLEFIINNINIEKIQNETNSKINNIFIRFMESSVPLSRASAYTCVSKLTTDINIDKSTIINDLSNEITQNSVILLITKKLSKNPSILLYKSLLECTKTVKNAWIPIFKLAESDNGSNFLINNLDWLNYIETSSFDICKLFLILFSNKKARNTLLNCYFMPQIIKSLIDLPEEQKYDALSLIFPFYATSKERISKISMVTNSPIIQNFFISAISGSYKARNCALIIADVIGRICFIKEFLIISKEIDNLLQIQEVAANAIQTAATLSAYEQCRSDLNIDGLISYFKSLLSYPAYESAAKIFIKNITKG